MCIYIHTYIYTCVYIYIYMYIMGLDRKPANQPFEQVDDSLALSSLLVGVSDASLPKTHP